VAGQTPANWLEAVGQFLDRGGVGVAVGAAGGIGLAALRWLIGRPAEKRKASLDALAMLGEVVDALKSQNEAQAADLLATRNELTASQERIRRAERRLARVEQWIDQLPMLISEECRVPLECPILRARRPNGEVEDEQPERRRWPTVPGTVDDS
jgi:hypothetical protein